MANLAAEMTLQNRGFLNPLLQAHNAVQGAVGGMKSAFGGLLTTLGLVGVGFGALKSAEGFADALKGVFSAGKDLATMHAITGQSITDIVTLRKAFQEAGLSPESLEGNLIKLQKALGGVNEEGQPTAFAFQQLGLSIEALKGESALEQIKQVTSAIAALGTDADRTAKATAIFGKAGAEMKAINPEAIEEAKASMAGYAAIMERNAGMFKKITNTLESLSAKMKGFFVGVAGPVGEVLLPLLQKLNSFKLTGLGQQLGQEIALGMNILTSGKLGELMGLSLEIGAKTGGNFLIESMVDAVNVLAVVGEPGFWGDVGNLLLAGAVRFGASMLEARAYLQAGFDYAMQSAKSLSFSDALTAFNSLWVQALLHPVLTLEAMLVGLALRFGKSIYEAIRGNLDGAKAALAAGQAASNPTTVLTAAFASAVAKSDRDTKGGGKKSYEDFVGERRGETSGLAGGLKATADILEKSGGSIAAMVGAALQKSAGMTGPFDTSGPAGKLATIIASLLPKPSSDTSEAPGEPGAPAGPGAGVGGAKAESGDRLAKIGLFIGGGGPANEHARKTADNTSKMTALMQQFLPLLRPTHMSDNAAAFA